MSDLWRCLRCRSPSWNSSNVDHDVAWENGEDRYQSVRETDLTAEFPIATVCKWIGNTPAIAAKHYVEPSDADFRRASTVPPAALPAVTKVAPAVALPVTIKMAVPTPELSRTERKQHQETPSITAFCECVQSRANTGIGPEGFEPPTKGL